MTEKERYKEMRELCCNDLQALCTTVLGYTEATEPNHRAMCQFIQQDYPRRFMVGARGVFKTCCCTVGEAVRACIQNPERRVLIVSNTDLNAARMVAQVFQHINENEHIRKMCPEMYHRSVGTVTWRKDSFVLKRRGVYSEPSVSPASVKTQKASGHYTDILGDDIVAADYDDYKDGGVIYIPQPEIDKAIGWEQLSRPGLSIRRGKGFEETRVQYIVNRWAVLDFAEFMMREMLQTLDNPLGFKFLELSAHDKLGNLSFPQTLSEEELSKVQNSFIRATQYECQPFDPSQRGFPPEDNTYWDGKYDASQVRTYCLMDLADAQHQDACFTALVVVHVDSDNHIWVSEAIRKRMQVPEKLRLIRHMLQKYDINTMHFEKNLHDETMRQCCMADMERTGFFYHIRALTHKNRNKDARIVRLQPHHEHGALHIRREHTDLILEMNTYPANHWKDLLDTLGYAMDFIRGPFALKSNEENIADMTKERNSMTVRELMEEENKKNRLRWGAGMFGNTRRRSAG